MTLQDMIDAVNRRVDDVIDTQTIIDYLNAGQNVMATEVGAVFTQFVYGVLTAVPDFDAKYHEIPILYACMRIKEMDSVLSEAQNYRGQFEERKKWFIITYQMPEYLRDDRLTQQFTAVDGQTAFVITKETYNPQTGNLRVYRKKGANNYSSNLVTWEKVAVTVATVLINGKSYTSSINDDNLVTTTTTTTNDPRGFILTFPCSLGDQITAVWEEHNDIANPPYAWWNGQGW
jgi:hypothetical protein